MPRPCVKLNNILTFHTSKSGSKLFSVDVFKTQKVLQDFKFFQPLKLQVLVTKVEIYCRFFHSIWKKIFLIFNKSLKLCDPSKTEKNKKNISECPYCASVTRNEKSNYYYPEEL